MCLDKRPKRDYFDTFVDQKSKNILFGRLNFLNENVKRFRMHQKLEKT